MKVNFDPVREGARVSYERPGKVAGLYLGWYRSMTDGRDHAVTDEQFLAGMQAGHGRYDAVCGHVVDVASLLVPPGTPCARCHAFLAALTALRDSSERIEPRRHRKRGVWRRLFRRSCTSAVVGRTPALTGTGSAPIASVPAGRHALRGAR